MRGAQRAASRVARIGADAGDKWRKPIESHVELERLPIGVLRGTHRQNIPNLTGEPHRHRQTVTVVACVIVVVMMVVEFEVVFETICSGHI